jgi:hypothetical protein
MYSPIYAARLLPADISVREVIRWQLSYSVVSSTYNSVGTAHIDLSASQSQFRNHRMLGNG